MNNMNTIDNTISRSAQLGREVCKADSMFKATEGLTSLEIAEITGKEHKNVLRDIRNLLGQGVHQLNFEPMFRISKLGNGAERKDPYYRLTPKGCLILASGYDALLREKIINRLEEYEKGRRPSYQEEDPIARAEAWIAEQKEKQALILENKRMQHKAEYFDNLVDRNLLTSFRDAAKQIGLKQNQFIALLLNDKYIYRDKKGGLKPYAQYAGTLFKLKDWGDEHKSGLQTMITPQGKETFRLLYN